MNQREEQRVIEALRAFTGGLTVTDNDIITASARFRSELEPPPRRRRTAMLVAAAAAAVVAGVVALQAIDRDEDSAPPATVPGPPTPSLAPAAQTLTDALAAKPYTLSNEDFAAGSRLTAQSMSGLWVLRPTSTTSVEDGANTAPMYVEADGGWRIGHLHGPFSFGVTALDGDTWSRRMDDRSRCAMNHEWVGYTDFRGTAAIAADGSLRMQLTSDTECTLLGSREVWDRLAPGSPVLTYFRSVMDEIDWEPSSATVGEGTYVAPDTGHVLVVNSDGSYGYYEDLTGDQLVATCQGTFTKPVEAGRTPGLDGYVFGHAAMRVTAAGEGCAPEVADQGGWVLLHTSPTDMPYQEPRAG